MARDHDRYTEDLAPYVLGALTPIEAKTLEEHLRFCGECGNEIEQLRMGLAVLARSVESVEPPPSLRDRLMREVEEEHSRGAETTPVSPPRPKRRTKIWKGWGTHPLIERLAGAVGAVLLLAGIAGFIPGITTNLYDGLHYAGHSGNAELLGLFKVSVLHNLVHLLFGVAGLGLARTSEGARAFLLGGGAIYLVLWVYGLLIEETGPANFVPLNTADNWLHFVLGAAMIGLGLAFGRGSEVGSRTAEA